MITSSKHNTNNESKNRMRKYSCKSIYRNCEYIYDPVHGRRECHTRTSIMTVITATQKELNYTQFYFIQFYTNLVSLCTILTSVTIRNRSLKFKQLRHNNPRQLQSRNATVKLMSRSISSMAQLSYQSHHPWFYKPKCIFLFFFKKKLQSNI